MRGVGPLLRAGEGTRSPRRARTLPGTAAHDGEGAVRTSSQHLSSLEKGAPHPIIIDETDEVLWHAGQLGPEALPALLGPVPVSAKGEPRWRCPGSRGSARRVLGAMHTCRQDHLGEDCGYLYPGPAAASSASSTVFCPGPLCGRLFFFFSPWFCLGTASGRGVASMRRKSSLDSGWAASPSPTPLMDAGYSVPTRYTTDVRLFGGRTLIISYQKLPYRRYESTEGAFLLHPGLRPTMATSAPILSRFRNLQSLALCAALLMTPALRPILEFALLLV